MIAPLETSAVPESGMDAVLARDIRGSRIGLYVPNTLLGGSGDVVSARKLSHRLRQLGGMVSVHTDTADTEQLARVLDTDALPGSARFYIDGARGPVSCASLGADGVRWLAATDAVRRASFGPSDLDLLVCIHEVPHRPDLVTCPAILVHEYGDHEARWDHVFDRDRTLIYRTGFVVENRNPGDISGGIYVSRELAGCESEQEQEQDQKQDQEHLPRRTRRYAEDYKSFLFSSANLCVLGGEKKQSTLSSDLDELSSMLGAAEWLSVYYVGQRTGSEDFVTEWCLARRGHGSPLPVMVAVRKPRQEMLHALDSSGVPYVAFVVDEGGALSRYQSTGPGAPSVCLVILEGGLPTEAFQKLLASANDVSLLTGDHSITEALSGACASGGGILPLLYVGYYEKAEDYALFLADFDPVVAAAYLGWVVPRADGTPRTSAGDRKSAKVLGAGPVPGLEHLFSPTAETGLRAAVASFFPWLLSSRASVVGGIDGAFVPQSFPRAVAHLLGGHNIDDLRVR